MPYELKGNCVIKVDTGETVKCHGSKAEAEAHMAALMANVEDAHMDKPSYHSERIAFEPFANVTGVLNGDPFKIFPVGKWYRGERVLDVTPDRLKEFASNVKAGLPRFNIPINLNHSDNGKVGTVFDADYMPDGPKGSGLYATRYELTDKGRKAVTEDGYDAVSGEAVWTLFDGAKYQDPQTGAMLDNVLTGIALCTKPYFGHSNVALFTATPQEAEHMADNSVMSKMKDMLKKMLGMMEAGDEDAAPEMTTAKKQSTEHLTADGLDTNLSEQGVKTMPNEIVTPTPPAPETFSVKAEEFAALQAKAAKVDQLESAMKDASAKAEKFAADLLSVNRARRHDQLMIRVEEFNALPVKGAELADRMQALEEKDPDLFKFFDELLGTVNATVGAGELFVQKSSALAGQHGGNFTDKIQAKLVEKFGGDPAKYGEAMKIVSIENPELAAAYAKGA